MLFQLRLHGAAETDSQGTVKGSQAGRKWQSGAQGGCRTRKAPRRCTGRLTPMGRGTERRRVGGAHKHRPANQVANRGGHEVLADKGSCRGPQGAGASARRRRLHGSAQSENAGLLAFKRVR